MTATPNQFEAPTEFTNVALIVEGKKLHVSKEFLAVHSPVFAAMCNGNFAEKGKDEIEIKEIVYEEFVELLNLIHPGWSQLTASSVEYIVKLADQFQMKDARDQSEKFLLKTDKVNSVKKLFLADQCNLQKLKNHCISVITCINELSNNPDYARLSDATKGALLERVIELLRGGNHSCVCHPVIQQIPFPLRAPHPLATTFRFGVMAASPHQFDSPSEFSNVVLIVEGKKIHVNKDFLSLHSPFFAVLFNRDFVEKGETEVEIKDLIYEEFIDLLITIYPGFTPLKVGSVEHILKLADRFQMKDARDQVVNFLMLTKRMNREKKITLAEQYNIPDLRDRTLNTFTSNERLLECFPNFATLSNETKIAIWNRMQELNE
ncbi:hypothetical protein PRIPAC_84961 [Pristionchus pacificus]|uniref:Btb-18 n=1 Tax=Pristionchus pacificus TaxID=54126 RepID=A0A2A6BM52_PRIPA|nr:hypothetical protein PRIPAC_84961 [Pristionchus pacificus]|eukprot:PDM66851.1 btb-18 [Pristionchus pacificus]